MTFLYSLLLSITLGGMVTFQLLFAPVLFTRLEMPTARAFIRAFFPFYYLYFGLLSVIAACIAASQVMLIETALFVLCAMGFGYSRQVLMPKANDATDNGDKKGFARLHLLTVIINTMQMLVLAFLIYRLVG